MVASEPGNGRPPNLSYSSAVERRTSSVSPSTRSSTTAAIAASSNAAAAATRSSDVAADTEVRVRAHVPLNPARANNFTVASRAAAVASRSSPSRPAKSAASRARSSAASRVASGGATTMTWTSTRFMRSSRSRTRPRAADLAGSSCSPADGRLDAGSLCRDPRRRFTAPRYPPGLEVTLRPPPGCRRGCRAPCRPPPRS